MTTRRHSLGSGNADNLPQPVFNSPPATPTGDKTPKRTSRRRASDSSGMLVSRSNRSAATPCSDKKSGGHTQPMAQLQRQVRQLRQLLMPKQETKTNKKDASNVRVICRFRPLTNKERGERGCDRTAWGFAKSQNLEDEQDRDRRECSAEDKEFSEKFDEVESVLQDDDTHGAYSKVHRFRFDHVLRGEATQADVYAMLSPMVEEVLRGYNGTIFAYGQTCSGKTHTMEGPDIRDEQSQGVIPRMVQQLFQGMEERKETVEYTAKVSMVEIYMERILDLLADSYCPDNLGGGNGAAVSPSPSHSMTPSPGRHAGTGSYNCAWAGSGAGLKVFEDKERGVYVGGATEVRIEEATQIIGVLRKGQRNRAVGATGMNENSSRSHSIFILNLEQRNKEDLTEKTGKLYLGSEKVKKTHSSGLRLDEAKTINKSLSALGNVINALTEHTGAGGHGDASGRHIPYRDSKLTRVLQESLGGNSRTAIVINCSPALTNRQETLSTLRFGERAKRMVNRAIVNEHAGLGMVIKVCAAAKDEIIRLHQLVRHLEGGGTREEWEHKLLARQEAKDAREGRTAGNAGSGGDGAGGEAGVLLSGDRVSALLQAEEVLEELERERQKAMSLMDDLEEAREEHEEMQVESVLEMLVYEVELRHQHQQREQAAREGREREARLEHAHEQARAAEVAGTTARLEHAHARALSAAVADARAHGEREAERRVADATMAMEASAAAVLQEEQEATATAMAAERAASQAAAAAALAMQGAADARRWSAGLSEALEEHEAAVLAEAQWGREELLAKMEAEWCARMRSALEAAEERARKERERAVREALQQGREEARLYALAKERREALVAKAEVEARCAEIEAALKRKYYEQELQIAKLRQSLVEKEREQKEAPAKEAPAKEAPANEAPANEVAEMPADNRTCPDISEKSGDRAHGGGSDYDSSGSDGEWDSALDKKTGRRYYYHSRSGKVSWLPPEGYVPRQHGEKATAENQEHEHEHEHKHEHGHGHRQYTLTPKRYAPQDDNGDQQEAEAEPSPPSASPTSSSDCSERSSSPHTSDSFQTLAAVTHKQVSPERKLPVPV